MTTRRTPRTPWRTRASSPAEVGTVRRGVLVALVLMGWLSLVLWLDRADGGGGRWAQRGLGVATWVVLLLALRRFTPTVRVQAVVVVCFATLVEVVFSPTLEVYLYRFDNVPAYVPPGHGLVYLSAVALGNSALVRQRLRCWTALVLVAGGAWAAYGLVAGLVAGLGAGARPDVLGAFWFLCLAGFLRWGPSTPVHVGAFLAVSHLELWGTHLGTWAWQGQGPVLGIPMGNPPSGAAGGYGWFDLVGLLLAPEALRLGWVRRLAGASGSDPPTPGPRRRTPSPAASDAR